MIAYLRGEFAYKSPALVHMDVSGVGYELQISLHTYARIEGLESGILLTYLHIREDAHILYGFFDKAEKDLFIQLISVSRGGRHHGEDDVVFDEAGRDYPGYSARECPAVGGH